MAEAMADFMEIVGTMVTTITGNTTLMVFFCAGLAGTAIGVVKKLRG